jgi:hypothetical protein
VADSKTALLGSILPQEVYEFTDLSGQPVAIVGAWIEGVGRVLSLEDATGKAKAKIFLSGRFQMVQEDYHTVINILVNGGALDTGAKTSV